MKKLLILILLSIFICLTEAYTVSKNGAVRRCFKKKNNSSSSPSPPPSDTGVKLSCKTLVKEVATDQSKEEPLSIKLTDNLIIPKGTLISNNDECVNSIYNLNKLVKKITNSNIFEQSCENEFDLTSFSTALENIKKELTAFMEESISKCGNSRIWNGANLHQACRTLSKTGQNVCYSIVDDAFERYDSKCLLNSNLKDMWEFSTWLWDQLLANEGCYLKQLYNYKCHPKKDAIVHLGPNTYSLRILCESDAKSCDWPGTYTGNNVHVQCLSKSIANNKVAAINVLKKNGYVCEGSDDLPKTLNVPDGVIESDDENENNSGSNGSSGSDSSTTLGKSSNNVNNPAASPNKKSYMVSSGSEPYTNMNQIIGTVFIALFALLF